MTEALSTVSVVLVLALAFGLVPVFRGDVPADRMLAAQLIGTTTVAILVLLSKATGYPGLLDIALVFVLLAAIALVCFVALAGRRAE